MEKSFPIVVFCKYYMQNMDSNFEIRNTNTNDQFYTAKVGYILKRLEILIIMSMLILCGCPDASDKNIQDSKLNVMQINSKAATAFINHYFSFFMKRDFNVMSSFYGKELLNKMKNVVPSSEPHPQGYQISEGEMNNNKISYNVNIYSGYTDKPYFSKDEFVYIVGIENGKTLIKDIEKKKSTEIYQKDSTIFKRNGEELQGEKLTSLKDLPEYIVPTDAFSVHKKIKIPNKSYGPSALSPDDKKIVFTTYDKNSFIGIIKEPEDTETLMQEGGKQGGNMQQSNEKNKIKAVDMLYDTVIHNLCFSPDGKKILIQYSYKGDPSKLIMYDAESCKMLPIKTNKQFLEGMYSFEKAYFENASTLIFTVIPVNNSLPENAKYSGVWALNLSKAILNKIE